MSVVRVCQSLLVILFVDFQLGTATPFFGGRVWCDLFCEDYDDGLPPTPSTTTTLEDALDALMFDPCSGCPTGPTVTANPTANPMQGVQGQGPMQPFNFMIPPSNGMNLTMVPNGMGSWSVNMVPWGGSPGTPNPAGNQAPTPTPAPASTPAATTPAPGATTPAAGSTTAAPTTAAG